MTNRKEINRISGTKWVHIKARGYLGFQTVSVGAGETVEQFKQLLGLSSEATVTVPTAGLPLADDTSLFDFVKNFDTVLLDA